MGVENALEHQGCVPGLQKDCKRAPCIACGPRFACTACRTGYVLDPKTKKCRECIGSIAGACGVCPKDNKGGVTLGKVSLMMLLVCIACVPAMLCPWPGWVAGKLAQEVGSWAEYDIRYPPAATRA